MLLSIKAERHPGRQLQNVLNHRGGNEWRPKVRTVPRRRVASLDATVEVLSIFGAGAGATHALVQVMAEGRSVGSGSRRSMMDQSGSKSRMVAED